MNLSNPMSSRPDYYDRTPYNRALIYSAFSVAPHGSTVRATYTVPDFKKAMIDAFSFSVMRAVAATTVGVAQAYILYTPNGGSSVACFQCVNTSNTANTYVVLNQSSLGILLPGDKVEIYTSDTSVGGNLHYNLLVKLFEFDA